MTRPPHIVLFNPDQWRGDVLGHMGHPAVRTPNLDRLVAEQAISFRHAFVQATVCTPSRCSFMTGWYPHVRGHRTMHHMLHTEFGEPNLLKVLRDHGYCVWWGGKNDLVPGQLGFEAHCDVHFRPTAEDYRRWGVTPQPGSHGGDLAWRGAEDGDNYFSFFKGRLETPRGAVWFDGDWAMVHGAIDFLHRYEGDRPLCLFLPLGYPHPPYCVEEPWFSLAERDDVPQRHLYERWDDKPRLLSAIRDGQRLCGWSEARWRELRATYYGMCSRVDHQLGLLLEALRSTERYDDSAVFVFSDHGDFTGDYGLVEKTQNTFQDCLSRVPFVVKPPASVGGVAGIRDQLVELVDLPATVYDLADIDCGYWHFGRSLVPLFDDAGPCASRHRVLRRRAAARRGAGQRTREPFCRHGAWSLLAAHSGAGAGGDGAAARQGRDVPHGAIQVRSPHVRNRRVLRLGRRPRRDAQSHRRPRLPSGCVRAQGAAARVVHGDLRRRADGSRSALLRAALGPAPVNETHEAVLDIVAAYASAWRLLLEYDEDKLATPPGARQSVGALDVDTAKAAIAALKQELMARKEASSLFGSLRGEALEAILGNIEQTMFGRTTLPLA